MSTIMLLYSPPKSSSLAHTLTDCTDYLRRKTVSYLREEKAKSWPISENGVGRESNILGHEPT